MGGQGRAVVLLSGGIDSAVCLYIAVRKHGPENIAALTFDWGQRCAAEEWEAATLLAQEAGVAEPILVTVRFPYEGLLTVTPGPGQIEVNKEREGPVAEPTFFEGRNMVLLSYAFGFAARESASAVYFGACADDAEGYPDCREDFVRAMERAANLALGDPGIVLEVPVIAMKKARIISLGQEVGVPWTLTFSCYAPDEGRHCLECSSCARRREAFSEAGLDLE